MFTPFHSFHPLQPSKNARVQRGQSCEGTVLCDRRIAPRANPLVGLTIDRRVLRIINDLHLVDHASQAAL